jgi:signal transduction histidine kinase
MRRSWFRRLPIRHKLVTMIMATSAAVLTLASVGYLATDYYQSRNSLLADLTAQANVILDNSTAAIQFRDPAAALETLQTLGSNPHITAACLYDQNGALFEQYTSARTTASCPAAPGPDGYHFLSDRLQLVSGVDLKGRRAGSLLVRSDLEPLKNRLRVQIMIVALLLAVALGVALLMSSRLQSLVSEPVSELARAASEVSSRGDYSIRATRTTDDELGVLVDGFNRMLERIELREEELSKANEELRKEVAERRRAEQERAELLVREREANRLKDEFLATLSHELRTPLNAILGWTRLLRNQAVPPASIDRALEKVERNAQVQSRLVEDLLEISRISTGKLRLDLRPLDLVTLTSTAIDTLRSTAEARGVAIERRFEASALLTAGDPDRLQQVIWNLLTNAVKFTPTGGVVAVTLRRVDGDDELIVSDTGIGIEPGFLPHVFDSFRQADASSTRAHGGLGLGLSIVKHLVELHGGTVQASSAGSNLGATFSVRLPVRIAEPIREPRTTGQGSRARRLPPEPSVPLVRGAGQAGRLSGTRVVVVDDDTDTRELVVSVLENAGANVRAAASADEGFQACVDERPDALISDIAMPGRDGYGLIRQLASTPGVEAPRIRIALTALAGARDRERTAQAGFQRHVAKPFDPGMLVSTLEELLAIT